MPVCSILQLHVLAAFSFQSRSICTGLVQLVAVIGRSLFIRPSETLSGQNEYSFIRVQSQRFDFCLTDRDVFDAACIVCGVTAELRFALSVYLSICPSIVRPIIRSPQVRVCCLASGGQEISIDCCTARLQRGAQQQMRAVPC